MDWLTIGVALAGSLFLPPRGLAVDLTPVAVASHANDPESVKKEGQRAATILREQKITLWPGDQLFDSNYWKQWVIDHQTGSAVVLFVTRNQSSEARLLLARAIKAEGLRITLRGEDAKRVTVESVLVAEKKK